VSGFVKTKTVDVKAHQYADKNSYRPSFSQWLKALTDFRAGYLQCAKDHKLGTWDELGNCHGISMQRIELLESDNAHLKERIENQAKAMQELRK